MAHFLNVVKRSGREIMPLQDSLKEKLISKPVATISKLDQPRATSFIGFHQLGLKLLGVMVEHLASCIDLRMGRVLLAL